MKHFILISFFFFNLAGFSQIDSLNTLDEVVLYGKFSPELNTGYQVEYISDSILKKQNLSLGNFLENYRNFYFKQNGNGMVSSISLRGTGASQTGVYWNGIAINSSLNGQTDFNTIPVNGFDALEIRRGGGSTLLGSGAIGGAINLSDKITFQNKKSLFLQSNIGSFESFNGSISGVLSSQNYFAKVFLSALSSENDYPYLDTDIKNENGEIKNYSIQSVLGWKINGDNQLEFYSSFVDNDRNTSRTITAMSNAKLLNRNNRYLLAWKNFGEKYNSVLKLAYLGEKYTYSFSKDLDASSVNESESFIGKYNFTYLINSAINLSAGLEYTHAIGEGNNLTKVKQDDAEAYVLLHHKISSKFIYNLSARKGVSSAYDIPLIYAADINYRISDRIDLKANYSTNFRLPTFNDLYWEPGGNPDLEPENSRSAEIGLNFKKNDFKIDATTYLIKSKDQIQWIPLSGDIWKPQNINSTESFGMELSAEEKLEFGNHQLQLHAQYNYAISKNKENNKQLIYVPKHKANANLFYQIKKLSVKYNLQHIGSVYTTTSNSQNLDAYWLSNFGADYKFLNNDLQIGVQINNLFNENYQSVAYRPMPGRNFNININYKID
ncbi:MAG: TonB-dependent receptor [Bacteroidota bacterium]